MPYLSLSSLLVMKRRAKSHIYFFNSTSCLFTTYSVLTITWLSESQKNLTSNAEFLSPNFTCYRGITGHYLEDLFFPDLFLKEKFIPYLTKC